MTILFVIAAIGALILLHELGHFIAARALGVAVLEFSLGFGPRIFSREINGTLYSIALIPLGGFVRLVNEDIEEGEGPSGTPLANASKPAQLAISFAGPLVNGLIAYGIYTSLAMTGIPHQTTLIGDVYPNTPAFDARIAPGDRILSVDNKVTPRWAEMIGAIAKSNGQPVKIVVERKNKEEEVLTLTPIKSEGRWILGLKAAGEVTLEKYGVASSFVKGASMLSVDIKSAVSGLSSLASNITQVAGPVSMVKIGSGMSDMGMAPFLLFLALISSNLFVLNLLPIPVLDGGNIVIILWEMAMGKPLSDMARKVAMTAGALFVFGLLVVALISDGIRIFI